MTGWQITTTKLLVNAQDRMCSSCQNRKTTIQARDTRAVPTSKLKQNKATLSGDCVSIDHKDFSVTGVVVQMQVA
jgi:hypothetical protein